MDKRYDANEQVIQYALIRREFNELGIVDVHRKDFAYKPVAMSKPNIYTDNWSGADENGHDTGTTSDAVELISTYDPGYYSSESNIDNDQQVSFRWWSWIDHFNQFFRQGYNNDNEAGTISGAFIGGSQGNSQSAYEGNLYEEDGHQAFAGGSHGEIWRARRRCPSQTTDCDDKKEYIVKRLKIELGYPVLEAGLREVYFGELLGREAEASNLMTTYVDHFFREGKKGQIELWIVFENAGISLRSYLYTSVVDADGGFTVLQHSPFWRRLRKSSRERSDDADFALEIIRPQKKDAAASAGDTFGPRNHTSSHNREKNHNENRLIPEGKLLLKDVMKQILTSVAFLHARGIIHR
eukprot:scaffold10249_cov59-Cyclotella_meneghiniana.AAC.15